MSTALCTLCAPPPPKLTVPCMDPAGSLGKMLVGGRNSSRQQAIGEPLKGVICFPGGGSTLGSPPRGELRLWLWPQDPHLYKEEGFNQVEVTTAKLPGVLPSQGQGEPH